VEKSIAMRASQPDAMLAGILVGHSSVKQLLKPGSIVVVLGPGGVGKTTVAAALGMAAAQTGRETAVLTIDPARRLRDALGLQRLGTSPSRIDARRLRAAGLDPQLPFHAITHDAKATWDGLVERFVPTAEARDQILSNSFYRNLTGGLAGAENYAALEQLFALHETARFAVEIVDTPPATQAFDFIEAPSHLAKLLASRSARFVFNWSKAHQGGGLSIANRLVRRIVEELEKFAGARPLSAIAEFFAATGDALAAITERMRAADAMLHSDAVRFVVVTTSAEDRLRETRDILSELKTQRLRLAGVVINRACDEATLDALTKPRALATAPYQSAIAELRALPTNRNPGDVRLAGLLDFLEDYAAQQRAAIMRSIGFLRQLPADIEVAILPEIGPAVNSLSGLVKIADRLARSPSYRVLIGRFTGLH
jgi:anion-transporting  ArsA/GET3 family ATPase